MRTSTRHPLPYDLQKSKRLSESSLMKLKCNSRTNTTLTLTTFFCPLCTPGSTGDTSTTPGPSALDVGCHCLPILKTLDVLPVVVDVSAQDGQKTARCYNVLLSFIAVLTILAAPAIQS